MQILEKKLIVIKKLFYFQRLSMEKLIIINFFLSLFSHWYKFLQKKKKTGKKLSLPCYIELNDKMKYPRFMY